MDIQSLVVEFFLQPSTSIERKQQIERALIEWKQRPDAYRLALPFISTDGVDPHIAWFGLSVYESLVIKWSHVNGAERRSIRAMFWDKLKTQHGSMAPFLLNKLIKLVVDIAKQEYPYEDPDFFNRIYDLQSLSMTLCLNLLKTVAEEFCQTGGQGLSAARKKELDLLFKHQIPNTLSIAIEVLSSTYQNLLIVSSTTTPAGSPSAEAAFAGGMNLYSPLKTQDKTLFPSIGLSPSRPQLPLSGNGFFVHGGRIRPENATNSGLALEIIQTILAIIPLEANTSSYLLNTIDMLYKFAQLNDDATVALGTLAITCLNELMSRNYVPPGQFVEFLLNISVQMGELMRFLVDESPLSSSPRLSDVDEMYKSKCIEFIHYFMSQHFARAQGHFPVESFLELLFKFTFLQTSADGFQACLKAWDSFLDFLTAQKENTNAQSRYQECVYSLTRGIVNRCLHSENGTELEELAERTETDQHGLHTVAALDVFRNHCAEIIVKAADLYPDYLVQYLYSLLESFMTAVSSRSLKTGALSVAIKDLTTLCIFFGRFAPLFTGSAEAASSVTVIFEKLLKLLQDIQAIATDSSAVGKLAIDLEKELFQMFVLNIHWISLVNKLTRDDAEKASQFKGFVGKIVSLSLISFSQSIPDVAFAGSSFMVSLTRTVRSNIMEEAHIIDFLQNVHSASISYRKDILRNVYIFITNLFTLPSFAKTEESEWASRADLFSRFCGGLGPIIANDGQVADKNQLLHTLNCMTAILQAVKDEKTSSKTVALQAILKLLPSIPTLLVVFSTDMDILPLLLETILNLFLSLSKQLFKTKHGEVLGVTLQTVLQQAIVVSTNTNSSSVVISEIVTSLCRLFVVVVEDSSTFSRQFLPDIIASVVYTIYPKYMTSDVDDLASARAAFNDLVYKIFLNHWNYFFGSQVNRLLGKVSLNLAGNVTDEASEHRGEFDALIQIVAESFKHSDVAVFKQNLQALQTLNEKCQLYTKIKQSFLIPFHLLFLSILISRSHDFLREDIISQVLAPMILVDLNVWMSGTIPRFLAEYCNGRMNSEDERVLSAYLFNMRDQISCMENLTYLINDYICFTSS